MSYALKIEAGIIDRSSFLYASGHRVIGDDRLVPEHRPAAHLDVAPEVAMAARERGANPRFTVDPGVGPQNGTLDHRTFADVAVPPEHAVGPNPRSAFDDRFGVDETRTLDGHALLDTR